MQPQPLTDPESVVWRSLLLLWRQGLPQLEPTFRAVGLNHLEYGLLAVLAEQPDRHMSAGGLARLAGISTSRLAQRLKRLESAGDITRRPDPHDARGVVVQVTQQGEDKVRRAYEPHLADVRRLIFDQLTPAQLDALADALAVVVRPLQSRGFLDLGEEPED